MRILALLVLFLTPIISFSQGRIAEEINALKISGAAFVAKDLVTFESDDLDSRSVNGVSRGVLVKPDLQVIRDLRQDPALTMSMELPLGRSSVTLELVQHDILTGDFQMYASSRPDQPLAYTPGVYYRGIIAGDDRSVVSVSIFNDHIMGVISSDAGNFVLGRIADDRDGVHIVYNDKDLQTTPGWDCETPDLDVMEDVERLQGQYGQRDPGDCVRVYIEIDDDIVNDKGVSGSSDYVTGLFNEVITLYANDMIDMSVSEIKVWDTPSPYSGSSSSAMLSSYQANTGSFNGDLSHLVSYKASGGIAAGFSGICNSNPDNSKCFSSIDATYLQVPTYSWSVMVVTHEMGHLIGSRHTHACVWNGNNTAIDGCAGGTEGSCPTPGNPPGGGTIMSYCHLTSVGINLNLGFGPQPGDVVRGTVDAAGNCLTSCDGPPPEPQYCFAEGTNQNYEWIQSVAVGTINNNSGSDGGYADYTAQSTDLTAGSSYTATLTPGFASSSYNEYWAIYIDWNGDKDFDDADELAATGSGNSTVSVTINVPASSPELTTRMRVVMDYSNNPPNACGSFTYGEVEDYSVNVVGGTPPTCDDGIQNGGETDVDCGGPDCDPCPTCDDGVQNGGETDVDCGGPDCPACPTCNDGIQNGEETGVDCGGPDCDPCPPGGTSELFGHYFESGWNGWADGGSDCYRYSGSRSYEGSYSIRIRDNSGTASSMTSPAYDITTASSFELEFYFYAWSMESGEDFWVQYNDGSGWTTLATYAAGTSFDNNNFYVATVTVTNSQVNFVQNAQWRFRCDASGNRDHIYIDAVTVDVTTGSSLIEPGQTITRLTEFTPVEPIEDLAFKSPDENELSVYPNPATNMLNIQYTGDIKAVKILSTDGVEVYSRDASYDFNRVDVSRLTPGLYFIMVQDREGEWKHEKFVKN